MALRRENGKERPYEGVRHGLQCEQYREDSTFHRVHGIANVGKVGPGCVSTEQDSESSTRNRTDIMGVQHDYGLMQGAHSLFTLVRLLAVHNISFQRSFVDVRDVGSLTDRERRSCRVCSCGGRRRSDYIGLFLS